VTNCAFSTPESLESAARELHSWRGLEDLSQFISGYSPAGTIGTLLDAYRMYLCLSSLIYGYESLVGYGGVPLGSDTEASDRLCFMRERHQAAIVPQLVDPDWRAARSANPKVRLRSQCFSVPSVTLTARAVLEGIAVIGELIAGARWRERGATQARSSVPETYRAALAYCLDCVNIVLATDYSIESLFAETVPQHIVLTIGMMLDFAIQIEDPASRLRVPDARGPSKHSADKIARHSALIEKSPAWRLLLIGAAVISEPHAFVLSEGCEFDDHDLREWGYMMADALGLQYPEVRAINAAAELTADDSGLLPISPDNIFEHMAAVASVRRSRSRLVYLQGLESHRDNEWLDFTAWQLKDGHIWFTDGQHREARQAYIAREERRHFGFGAMLAGRHWDHWWQEQHATRPGEHTEYISDLLLELMVTRGIPDAEREVALRRSFDVRIRDEYAQVFRR
jgi:hypothetical protein